MLRKLWERTSPEVQDRVIEIVADKPEHRRTLEEIVGKNLVDGVGFVDNQLVIIPKKRAPRNTEKFQPKRGRNG